MNFIIHNYYDVYNYNDAMFDPEMYNIGDDLHKGVCELRKILNYNGHKLHTRDQYKETDKIDAVIYQDFPSGEIEKLNQNIDNGIKNYLIIYEAPVIKMDNYIADNHNLFEKIFTWADDLVSLGGKYRKIYWPVSFPEFVRFMDDKKHACMVSCNKYSDRPESLYNNRLEIVNWYHANKPNNFDLYGHGWPDSSIYKGSIKHKRDTIKNYKFCYCMENARYNGYITEKIWDVWFSGSVPIYFMNNYFPPDTYIPIDKFKSIEELEYYLSEMPQSQYEYHLDCISKFLISSDSRLFNATNFGYTIAMELIGGNNE